ncbi:MAG: hypothetical protein V7750_17865, partial [Sneathiella sp.]
KRSKTLLARPISLEPAFENPQGVVDLIRQGSPYKTLAAVHKNKGDTSGGWFRNFWALGGKATFDGAEPYFQNEKFIEGAKQSFKAEVIRPVAMMTNLNLPAPGAPYHLDLPFFRGAQNREVPSWMLAPMGYSGLFQEWAIPVASAITWFYQGEGGEFEYWPDGLGAPSLTEAPPYFNRSVLADNEYMYHRVGAIGPKNQQKNYENIGYDAVLELNAGDKWCVREDNKTLATFAFDQVRVSVLWKAYCFKDQAMAASYDDHSFDLTPQMIADIFCADLKSRALPFKEPGPFETDLDWKKLITTNYEAPDGGASY